MSQVESPHPAASPQTEEVNAQADRDALADRLFKSVIGALELYHVYLGERLGLYRALASGGPQTSVGLASAAGISERYGREWLEEQAVAGILTVELDSGGDRAYSLPCGHAEVLVDADSVNFLAPLGRAMVGIGGVMPAVVEAFRFGGGVSYEAYGADMRGAIATLNRPAFLNLLGTDWFPAVPELDQRLRSHPPARIADLGCGTGWSSIAMARAYPLVRVDGIDLDLASVEEARVNAAAAGVADRVTFEVRDASDPRLAGSYDLVTAFETIHDMSRPVEALRAMRNLARQGAYVVVMDEKTAEEFSAPGDELQRFLYGWSAVHCLAASMVDPASAATGTIMRPDRLRQYAVEAGFAGLEVLPIEHDSWRFYHLIDTNHEGGVQLKQRGGARRKPKPELPEYAVRNREAWTTSNAAYTAGKAREMWASDPHWGVWHAPEAELKVLPKMKGLDVIELGCGTAYWAAWLKRLGARRVVGVDVTPAQLTTAREMAEEFGLGIELIESNAEAVPLPDATFDLAFSEYGASIWCDPYLWIPEAARLLRSGGELVFMRSSTLMMLCSPDEGRAVDRLVRPQKGIHKFEWPPEGDDPPATEFHIGGADMFKLLRDTGFEVLDFRELFAPDGAVDHPYYSTAPAKWARQWPAEEIWRARKR